MKKPISLILLAVLLMLGCDKKEVMERYDFAFHIFRLTDESYKELIITSGDVVHNIPKRSPVGPYFGLGDWRRGGDIQHYYFDICELATEEKYLALHNNYYTHFPYTGISYFESAADTVFIRDGKWEEICDTTLSDLPIMGHVSSMYSEIREFEITSLEKITHMNRWKMSIDDITKAINKVIDDGELDKYSKVVNRIRPSAE